MSKHKKPCVVFIDPSNRPCHNKSRHKSHTSCKKHIATARQFIDLFTTGDYTALISVVPDTFVFNVHDSEGQIPYGGIYIGRESFSIALDSFSAFIASPKYTIDDFYINKDCSRVTYNVAYSQVNKCIPDEGTPTSPFSGIYIFIFTFSDNVISQVDVYFDTGALDNYYSTCRASLPYNGEAPAPN